MSNVRKTLQMTSLLFGMTILFCYIGWHLGYEGFIIVGDIILPYFVEFVIRCVLLLINMSLYGGFILRLYSWRILVYSIPLVCLEAIRSIFFPDVFAQLTNAIIPMVILLIIGISKGFVKRTILSVLLFEAVTLAHNLILSKITSIPLTHDISLYFALRVNLDVILVYLLIYSIGGVNHEHEQMVFPGRTGTDRNRNEVCQVLPQSAEFVPVNKFEKWVMRSVIGVVQVIQWMFILWVCSLDNLFLDALVMTTSFICHGMIISKRKHLKPILLCTFAATAMFYFAARFTISFQYSQLFSISIGLLLVYVMYRISYQIEESVKEKAKADLERIEALERQMAQAWQQLDELS